MALISERAKVVEKWEDFLNKYMNVCNANEYDPSANPEGYINLGTAVNNMCCDMVYPKLVDRNVWHCDTTLLQYREAHGIFRLRRALAQLMSTLLKTYEPVEPDNLYCVVGVTAAIDLLAHCLADPGDVILTPTPVYGRIKTDLLQRSLVEMWPIPVITKDNEELSPYLTLNKVEEAFYAAVKSNKRVCGILLLNPSNPLGDVYTPELLENILKFCHKHELHAIIDEVYALSVFSEEIRFQSVLRFPELPDPQRTHVLYGISKDFAVAGLRIGAIYTKCEPLQNCLQQLSFYQGIPFPVMDIAARLIEDLDWCRKFVVVNKQRMGATFKYCCARLLEMNLTARESAAGFFLWVNFREVCGISTFEEEINFFKYLLHQFHLYIVPGRELFCEQPGWFRICFTAHPDHVSAGLKRLENALRDFRNSNMQEMTACYHANS